MDLTNRERAVLDQLRAGVTDTQQIAWALHTAEETVKSLLLMIIWKATTDPERDAETVALLRHCLKGNE